MQKKLLEKYNHPHPKKPQHTSIHLEPIQYGNKVQYTTLDNSKQLRKIHCIQSVIGKALYFARIIYSVLLPAVNEIGMQQAKAMKNTKKCVNTLLDYIATNPEAETMYRKLDMKYKIHGNPSYLSVSKRQSRVAGYHYIGDNIPLWQLDDYNSAI